MSPGGDKSGCATSMAKGRKPKLLLKKISVMKKGILALEGQKWAKRRETFVHGGRCVKENDLPKSFNLFLVAKVRLESVPSHDTTLA